MLHSAGEVGELLIPYYEYALRLVPGLATARINNGSLPGARQSFADGRHSIDIPLEATSQNRLRDMITSGGLAHIAETLGMQPEELAQRPDLLYIHAGIHELGHIVQYQQYASDPEAFEQQRQREIAALPIPGWNHINLLKDALADENSELSVWVRGNWEMLQKRYEIQSVEELINVQSIAKRNMFHERFADEFATRVIKAIEEERLGKKELIAV